MPYYEYDCRACGTFEMRRPLTESAQAAPCPVCGKPAARKLSAPFVSGSAVASPSAMSSSAGCGSGGCGHKH